MKLNTIEYKGKSGQERANGKKTGGVMFAHKVSPAIAEQVIEAILVQNPGKFAQLAFAYGLTAGAQADLGYAIPGAVVWEDGKDTPVHEWTQADADDYVLALKTYAEMESNRAGGPNTVELRGFFRAMQSIGQDYEASLKMAQTQKVRHAENEELALAVWERAKAV